jgi:rubrerythrin
MKTTMENLKEAFAGESQAFQKYMAFAEKARKEGLNNVAKLFETTAQAEKIHANGHLKAMEGIGSTLENLKVAISGETFEFEKMYPPMYEQAKEENHKAKKMFKWAMDVEEVHAQLYKKALQAVEQGKDLEETNFYLCPICGHIEMGNPPQKCPFCGLKGEDYILL